MKILVSCVSGMGSSQMIKMKIKKVCDKLGIKADITHLPVGEAKPVARNYDAVFCSISLVSNFNVPENVKVIGLRNLLSEQEIEDGFKSYGLV